jgi:peptide/nickel transport system ATP-binding protein
VTSGRPRALVLDEPTTGLDPAAKDLVLRQLDDLATRRELAVVLVTHDLDAAVRLCGRVLVLRGGALVEQGPARTVLTTPATAYVRELVRAVPSVAATGRPGRPAVTGPPVLRVRDLAAGHRQGRDDRPVVSGVSFEVRAGECLALLGPSGSGKTTVARCVAGTHRRSGGTVSLHGADLTAAVRDRTVDQRRRIQVVPQHPVGSLNPRRTIGATLMRPLRLLQGLDRAAARREAARLLAEVGLSADLLDRHPGRLSGGQSQRVAIARALAARPDVLICDEMTSSLDVRVQAAVLDLLDELRARFCPAVLLITHDAGVVARTADRVLVLDGGAGTTLGVGDFLGRVAAEPLP